ncbi:MAG: hypothetical protein IPL39_19910 [Opitutaceae bacterium]|nr:hypothetical protein [Opitutaceae bacterium]
MLTWESEFETGAAEGDHDHKAKLEKPGASALVATRVHGEPVEWIKNHTMKIDMGLRRCPKK